MSSTSAVLWGAVASGAVVGLVVVAAARVFARRWADAPVLAPAYGLLGLGLVAVPVFAAWLTDPLLGRLVSWVVLVSAVAVVLRALRGRSRADLHRTARSALPLVTVTAALLFGSASLLLLWRSGLDVFALAANRFSHTLPVDGQIPSLVTERLAAGLDPRTAVPGWASSDRPPLQAGLLLLSRSVFGGLLPGSALDAAGGMVAQSTWVLGAWCLARATGSGRRATVLGVLLAGTSGSLLLNTVFTWPKLLSVAFALAALALALHARRSGASAGRRLPEIAVLLVLGVLSHGAAAFAVPVVVLCLGRPTRALSRRAPVALAGAVVVYLPWWAYQRFYDPPGDRLLSMHLAGVPEPTAAPFLADLAQAYGSAAPGTIVADKLANLAFPFGTAPWADMQADWAGTGIRATQFYTVSGALALAWVPLLLVIAAWAVSFVHPAARAWRGSAGPVVGVLGACLVGLVVWALLMFGPGTTYVHQGSHLPIIVAGVIPTAWLATRSVPVGIAVVVVQVVCTAVVYVPGDPSVGIGPGLDTTALVVLGLALLAGVGAVLTADESAEDREPPPTTDATAGQDDLTVLAPHGRAGLPPVPQGRYRA